MDNNSKSQGRKGTVLSRIRAALGPDSAPSGLGLLFLLSMVHELSRADTLDVPRPELSPRQLAELADALIAHPADLQVIVDVIRDSYPELSDRLFDEQVAATVGAPAAEVDLQALAQELAALEASGYLAREEFLRLNKALKALQEGNVWSGEDIIVAQGDGVDKDVQADTGKDGKTDAKQTGTESGAEGAASSEGMAVDIDALPPTGAGPLALGPALGPVLAASGAVAVAAGGAGSSASSTSTTRDTTPPAAPTFALTVDTGASNSDGITSDGRVTVSGLESGATWQYSTNSGTTWTTGSGSSFTLASNTTFAAGSVQVRQTDAAGNTSTATNNGSAITVDTTAPVASSLTAVGGSNTIGIVYDSTLDATNTAATGNFSVTVNGGSVNVTGVAVSGSTVTLTLASSFTTGQTISVTYTDPSGSNDANATQDVAGNDAVTVTTGKAADGYVRGAQIYIDTNGNGQPEESEKLGNVVTDANGNFFLPGNAPTGAILAVGGVNIDTGLPNNGILKAPSGSTMISPLTTLVQAYLDANPSATASSANTAVLSALNLPTGTGIDLSTYDPLAILSSNGSSSEALAVQKAAAQVATVVELAAKNPGSGGAEVAASTVINNLVSQISTAVNGGSTVNLTDNTVLTNVLTGAASNASTVAGEAKSANDNIFGASTISAVSTAQAVALDTTPPAKPTVTLDPDFDTGSSSTDGITKNTTVDVRVSFNTTALDGTAVVVGNKVSLFDGNGQVGSDVTLTATHISQGYVDINVSGLSGTTAFTAKVTDLAGNGSTLSSAFNVTVDQSAPAAPTLTLVSDTGSSSSDLITSNGTVNVSGLESGASWQYSTDGGSNWTTGSGSSFALTGDGSKSVLVRQTDVAGNGPTSSSTLSFTLDATAPGAPVINTVAGNNNVDAGESLADITINGTAQANAALTVIWGNVRLTTTADSSGVWNVTVPQAQIPADGNTTVVALAQDTAGNLSAAGTRAVSITSGRADTTAPDAPVINTVAGNDIVNATEKATGVTLSGTAESGSTVRITWGGTTKSTTATADGSWSSTFASGEIPATGNISVTATDNSANANVSAVTTRTVTIDTAAPAAPVINVVAGNNIVNASEKSAGVAVAGTAEAGSSVAVTWGGTTQTVTADGSGNWTTTFASSAVPASGNITAVATDAAGNAGSSTTRTVTIDTSAPTAPTISTVSTDNRVNASEKTAGVTVTGTAEAGSSVAVTWGTTKTVTADASGNWSATFASTEIPTDGSRTITAVATDAAGNASSAGSRTVTVDTTAPTSLSFNAVAGNDRVSVAERTAGVTVSGTAELGSTVTLTWGSVTKTVTVGATGNWSTTFSSSELPAANGSNTTLSATVRDLAGNVSASATTRDVVMETLGNNKTGVTAASLLTDAGTFDTLTLAANQTFSLSAADYLGSAYQTALPKITNAVGEYTINVTAGSSTTAAEFLSIGANANVDSITWDSGRTLTITASQYSANSTALGKISNAASGYTLHVIDVPAANVLSIAGDAKVDQVTLLSGQTLGLTYTQYSSNTAALGKIQGSESGYTLNVTGITSSNFVAALAATGGDAKVDNISLASGQTVSLTAAQYGANSTGLAKISNGASDYTLNITDVTSSNALTIGANTAVDHLTLASGQSFSLSLSDYNASQTAFGKISNATGDYSVTIAVASANEASDIANLAAQGNASGRIDFVDALDNAITISAAQASALVQAGLEFATEDSVTLQQATGTHLTTSLSGLQHLGVDAITVTGVGGEFVISASSGTVDYAHLPTISADSSVLVGLELADNLLNAPTTAEQAAALKTAGIDVLMAADGSLSVGSTQIEAIHSGGLVFDAADAVTMDIASANESTAIAHLVTTIGSSNYHGDIDVLHALDGAISITDVQASTLVGAGLAFATNDTVTDVADVSAQGSAVGTHLQTSLHGLQQLGVDMLTITGATTGVVDIQAGGTVDFAHLPDVSAPSGVLVGLEMSDAALDSLTNTDLTALASHGFDALSASDNTIAMDSVKIEAIHTAGLELNPADSVTMQIASANESTAIASLVTAINTPSTYHGDLDVLDVIDNAISITDAQASSLVNAGLVFATGDTVTDVADVSAQGSAVGTHLQTSLHGLQQLGVDMLTITGATTGVVDIQAGGTVDFAHLPDVSAPSGVLVGLEMSDAALDSLTNTDLTALASHGFDALSASDNTIAMDSVKIEAIHTAGLELNPADSVTMQIASANESTAIASLVTAINTPSTYHGDLDVLDVIDNAIGITDAQASSLVQAGLHFAAGDTDVAIIQSHAAGTHLNTSLSELQHLGVDYVHTDAGTDTLVVNFGSGLNSNTLPVFDAIDEIKLVVQDSSLSQVVDFLNAPDKNDPHLDQLDVVLNAVLGTTAGLSGNGILDTALQAAFNTSSTQDGFVLNVANSTLPEITLGMVLDAADGSTADPLHMLADKTGNALAAALQAAGVADINIDAITHFSVSDSDLKPLLDAGLITAAAGAEVTVANAGADGSLDVTLAQLANIGADHVQTGGTSLVLDAGVSFSTMGGLEAALNGLVNTFNAQGVGTNGATALFENSDTVELRVSGDLTGQAITDTALLAKLQLLGIDEIKDEHNHSIKPT